MAASSEVKLMLSSSLEAIENIENRLNHSALTQSLSNSSRKTSSTIADDGRISDEKSILEKLANGGDNKKGSKHFSGKMDKILENLEHLIVSNGHSIKDQNDGMVDEQSSLSVSSQKKCEVMTPYLSDLSRVLVFSASIKNYINLLGLEHKQNIPSVLYEETTHFMSAMFHMPVDEIFCSQHEMTFSGSVRTGIGQAVRLALRDAYGQEYQTKGWKVFAEKGAPVVYVSPALHIDIASYISSEFGISDVVVIKKVENHLSDIEARMDCKVFEEQIDADIAAGKRPLMVVCVVGSPIIGLNDIVSRLLEIRKNRQPFWIHVFGQGLAALCSSQPSKMLVHVLTKVDSMTVPMSLWLGIPVAPVITFHRAVSNHKTSYAEKLEIMPWWIASKYFTVNRMRDMIEFTFNLTKLMVQSLSVCEKIRLIGIDNPIDFAARVGKGSISPTVLLFKYRYMELEEYRKKHSSFEPQSTEDSSIEKNEQSNGDESSMSLLCGTSDLDLLAEYGDCLNAWLGQGLIAECPRIGLQILDLGGEHGTVFRFSPLESAAVNYTVIEDITKFVKQLSDSLIIIESTVTAKKYLNKIIHGYPSLVSLPVRKWAGVGAVCYVPSIVKETDPTEWNEKQRQQVSHLNLELVHSLRSIDTAFSAGESTAFGVSCVKFGMLSDDKDLADLVRLVAERGKQIEDSQQYMDSLANMIRQGIEAANEDLKRENDARLMQEGVMRQIPLMGSLINWFSPLDRDTQNVKGRSFDLKTGEIHSTDYKHRLMNHQNITAQEPHHALSRHMSNEYSTGQENGGATNGVESVPVQNEN